METQVQEMHRKYRIMEGNRKAYSEDSQNVIRRQRAAIEKLKLDNAMLKAELALESRDKLGAPSLSSQKQIEKLQA